MEGGESSAQIIKNVPSVLKADIWTHYGFYELKGKNELDKSHAVCKVCHTKIKYLGGNTTNLRNHLSRFHCEKLTPATKKTADPAQRRIDETLSTFPPNSEKAKKITQSVAAFIAKDLRPYSVVENAGFRHLLKTLEPRYKLPSRSHFTENVIPALYNGTKAQVMASMIQAKRVAITCDAWTSVATESYLTVTAHYISEDWQFLSHVLQTRAVYESHTGAHVAELLSRVVEEWQLSDKDVVLVTDNASNMIAAAEFGKFPHVKCFAHTLNLASQRALKVATLSRLLGRVRRISTFFHRSTTANHYLKEKQKCLGLKNHKLITDVATRWNSAYDMVERFLEQQPAICATLLSPEVRKGQSDLCTLNETDVSNAEDAVSALKPMKDATTLMSEESNPTVSLIAPINAQLFQDMTGTIGDSPMIHAIKNAIKTDLLKRYNSEAEKKILHTASALDPRFKGLPFLTVEERLEVYRGVTEEAASLENERTLRRTEVTEAPEVTGTLEEETPDGPSAPKRKASSSSLLVSLLGRSFTDTEGTAEPKTPYASAEEEMERYCKASSLPLTEDPLNWWRVHEITFPLLSRVSKRYLCIPGTSVSAERVFSTAGDVVTAKRSTLKPEHVDQLVFLQKNLQIPKC
ncbi:Zinc finger BED domain containing protein 1 [Dissostichus eleginoides]|uniref:Zinc finger BED domain containing protein 1 n=1 Tax=Dissostichus eleginoides TaxID=100907 RepID=A0AAD9CCG6_DISEL|nr:Zinc finger BED domain containing protein 1 [Dissostichus eleginoides]